MNAKLVATLVLTTSLGVSAFAKVSQKGVVPLERAGNFVSSNDDQVCYDMVALGYLVGPVTEEMRGFKIDPPVSHAGQFVTTTVSADGKNLAWSSLNGAQVLGVIVKGGAAYHMYDYSGTLFSSDAQLVSPISKKNLPAISHYNVCYRLPAPAGDQGCDHGYWYNHADRWAGVVASADFDATFGVDLFTPNITLGAAVALNGGGANALARHATAALLNSYGGVPNSDGTTVAYPYTTSEVIAMVQDAAGEEGDVEATKNLLEAANKLGCPLNGTKAVKVR